MGYYYYYRDPRDEPGYIFGSILSFLLIVGLFLFLAIYLGSIILAIFLGIGALIGVVYAIVTYVKSFIFACRTVDFVGGRTGIGSVFLIWWQLFSVASVAAFKNNLNVAKNAISRSRNYKFLSFRKWMWFIVAPSVLLFGTAMIAAIAFATLSVAIGILAVILAIYLVIGIVYALVAVGILFGQILKADLPASKAKFTNPFPFSKLKRFSKDYFSTVFANIKNIWRRSITLILSNFESSKGFSLVSPARYFLFFSSLVVVPIALIFIALTFILSSIVFIPLFIAQFVWTLISKIFK